MNPTLTDDRQHLNDRLILTLVADITLVIPAIWVAEIIRLERTQVLTLPFYNSIILGISHYQGLVLPLISSHGLLQTNLTNYPEKLMVVKLNSNFGLEQEIGLVVDKTLSTINNQELSLKTTNNKLVKLSPELIPPNIWHPQRWFKD